MTKFEEAVTGKLEEILQRLTKLETVSSEGRRSRASVATWTSAVGTVAAVIVSVIVWADAGAKGCTASIEAPSKSRHFTNGSLAEAFCDIEPDP